MLIWNEKKKTKIKGRRCRKVYMILYLRSLWRRITKSWEKWVKLSKVYILNLIILNLNRWTSYLLIILLLLYIFILQGEGIERILFKDKKDQLDEKDGDSYKYFLLAGTSHPYPDDTFYSVGRVPRKLLMKYLGVKMYLVRLRSVPTAPEREEWVQFRDKQVRI